MSNEKGAPEAGETPRLHWTAPEVRRFEAGLAEAFAAEGGDGMDTYES